MPAPSPAEQFATLERQGATLRFGMWLFLTSELLLFSGFFALYGAYRATYGSDFEAALHHNTLAYGSVNTTPDGTRVQLNTVLGNGANPQPPLSLFFPGVDLLWDGSAGTGNCWWQNKYGTSFPDPLPACR